MRISPGISEACGSSSQRRQEWRISGRRAYLSAGCLSCDGHVSGGRWLVRPRPGVSSSARALLKFFHVFAALHSLQAYLADCGHDSQDRRIPVSANGRRSSLVPRCLAMYGHHKDCQGKPTRRQASQPPRLVAAMLTLQPNSYFLWAFPLVIQTTLGPWTLYTLFLETVLVFLIHSCAS